MIETFPDFDNAQLRQISNDTYFFFARGEEPLDDANRDEIQELQDEFPQGFQLMDEYDLVEGTDLVEVLLVPIASIEEVVPELTASPEYEWALELFNNWEVRFKRLSDREVYAFYYHPIKGIMQEGNYPLEITKNGDEYIAMGRSMYPLKRFAPF